MADPSVERINALTQNARSTWFALLSVLLFVGITLMSVSDIDFYGADRATDLPLINVSVPTPLFFYASPILTAAVYSYFHLYLIRLWDALADAPTRIEGRQLSDAVTPWLITDAALFVRRFRRKDNSAKRRPLEFPSALLNIILAWGGGWLILGFVWLQSLPAREFWMTAVAAASFLAVLWAGLASLIMAWLRLGPPKEVYRVRRWTIPGGLLSIFIFVPGVFAFSYLKTEAPDEWPAKWVEAWPQLPEYIGEQPTIWLAELDLTGEDIVERPANWLPYEIARKDFLAVWCKRETTACETELEPQAFVEEWHQRLSAQVSGLRKPHWHTEEGSQLDLRDARAAKAYLPGVDLSKALLQRALLVEAQMQGARLNRAEMSHAIMRGAEMQLANLNGAKLHHSKLQWTNLSGADLSGAEMQNANLSGAQLNEAVFRWAKMQGTNLSGAKLQGASLDKSEMQKAFLALADLENADFSFAIMTGVNLSGAKLVNSDLMEASIQNADFTAAKLHNVNLSNTKLQNVNFDGSLIGAPIKNPIELFQTDLSGSRNYGGAIRSVDFTYAKIDASTDWRNVFFDASVSVPKDMRDRIGSPCWWDWVEANPKPLKDFEYFARWRGWLSIEEKWGDDGWERLAPPEFRNVPLIPPPADCKWITDPLPGAAEN
ncbi:pentapeptide repeat-containing protein [Shimia sp. R9_1]|uniref:pentapeptide repeat-containing protein n=1 Tax=Shimia sp. R9_1 TaxID=2821111 RepID=UPI001ADD115B|nr:pentapeptide repeat-containing protein [Shimia sp. R9_1]MBO9408589.1 pentapeptide repeat-containing protein [Shimia sp. R9_1]